MKKYISVAILSSVVTLVVGFALGLVILSIRGNESYTLEMIDDNLNDTYLAELDAELESVCPDRYSQIGANGCASEQLDYLETKASDLVDQNKQKLSKLRNELSSESSITAEEIDSWEELIEDEAEGFDIYVSNMCRQKGLEYYGGSAETMLQANCKIDLYKSRIMELRNINFPLAQGA